MPYGQKHRTINFFVIPANYMPEWRWFILCESAKLCFSDTLKPPLPVVNLDRFYRVIRICFFYDWPRGGGIYLLAPVSHQNFSNHFRLGFADEANNLHLGMAVRTFERIYFPHFLDAISPRRGRQPAWLIWWNINHLYFFRCCRNFYFYQKLIFEIYLNCLLKPDKLYLYR